MSCWSASHGYSSLGPVGLGGEAMRSPMEEAVEGLMEEGDYLIEGCENLTGGRDPMEEVVNGPGGGKPGGSDRGDSGNLRWQVMGI